MNVMNWQQSLVSAKSNLWSSAGTKLATATFSGEAASGWHQVIFATPVAITADTVYEASCRASNGHYSEDDNYFVSKRRGQSAVARAGQRGERGRLSLSLRRVQRLLQLDLQCGQLLGGRCVCDPMRACP